MFYEKKDRAEYYFSKLSKLRELDIPKKELRLFERESAEVLESS